MTSEAPTAQRVRSRAALVGLGSGVLFALGLALSGMTNPGKVLGFLDVAGQWDPTLAFVMGGAVGFHGLWLRFVAARFEASSGGTSLRPPARIDARLVTGSAIFGLGWGLSGYCPGPALVTSAYGRTEALWFSVALLAGAALFRLMARSQSAELLAAAPSSPPGA